MDKNPSFSWKTVLIVSGAFASYHIGSGFASGQEVLQFFGSWGSFWPLVVPLITAAIVVCYCISGYGCGSEMKLEKPSDVFEVYCGKTAAKFVDIFSMIIIAGIGLVMFAGSGATINHYLGFPVYVGAIFMGVIAVAVVWLGLEKVTQVLGIAGIGMISFILVVTLITAFQSDVGMVEAQRNLADHVAQGKVLQAGIFGIYNPIVSGIIYGGNTLIVCFTFLVAIGKGIKGRKEIVACSIGSAVLITLGVYLVAYTVLQNIDHIVETGTQIPMLTATTKALPILTLPFTLVIICGTWVFTLLTHPQWVVLGHG